MGWGVSVHQSGHYLGIDDILKLVCKSKQIIVNRDATLTIDLKLRSGGHEIHGNAITRVILCIACPEVDTRFAISDGRTHETESRNTQKRVLVFLPRRFQEGNLAGRDEKAAENPTNGQELFDPTVHTLDSTRLLVNRNLFFLGFCLFFAHHSPTRGEVQNSGLFFSEKQPLALGHFHLGLEWEEPAEKFLIQEIHYHQKNGWEEWIYQGKIKPATICGEGKTSCYSLQPEICQVRAGTKLGEKKGLLRRFDCDHLLLDLFLVGSVWTLGGDVSGKAGPLPLPLWVPGVGKPRALLLEDESGGESFWGFHLNGLANQFPEKVWNSHKRTWVPLRSGDLPRERTGLVFEWKRAFSN